MNKVPAYSIRSLVQIYDGKTVLNIPRLDIPSGQVCGVLGPNGSGKTALLSVLALLRSPVSGSVLLNGIEATPDHCRQWLGRDVTLIHQKPVLFSTTVRKNVSYGLRALGLPMVEIKTRVQAALQDWRLLQLAERQAQKLSGGEAQRVVLARGLVLESPIILLDEPTNSLDEAFRPLLVELLSKANRTRSATIVIATHELSFLSSVTDRIVRLEDGRIQS
jgi:tungstate transport system ATP-binding protein